MESIEARFKTFFLNECYFIGSSGIRYVLPDRARVLNKFLEFLYAGDFYHQYKTIRVKKEFTGVFILFEIILEDTTVAVYISIDGKEILA